MKLKNNKFIMPILFLIILVLCYIDVNLIFKKIINANNFAKESIETYEKNKEQVFRVSKIIKYSSAEAVDNSSQQNLQDVSIHQYSDIAIYIDNFSDDVSEKNTIKELYLYNFKIDVAYKYGTPLLFYKNPLEISKFRLIEKNEIKDKLSYEIINTNEENDESKYEKPVFFADCSNPIVISYINKDIITNYQVTKENGTVSFDGRIFNNIDVNLNELSPKISFTIHIKNNLNEEYICNCSSKFNLETDDGSIKSGYIIQIDDDIEYYNFYKL